MQNNKRIAAKRKVQYGPHQYIGAQYQRVPPAARLDTAKRVLETYRDSNHKSLFQ
jgi:hypothetical protein